MGKLDSLLGVPQQQPDEQRLDQLLRGSRGRPTGALDRLLGGPTTAPIQLAPVGETLTTAGMLHPAAVLLLGGISKQETGGNYGAVGRTSVPGQGRALGRYQFMPATLISLGYGSWLKSTRAEDYRDMVKANDLAQAFLSRPDIQDQAAASHIQNIAKGLGIDLNKLTEQDVAKIAAAWVGGVSIAKDPGRWIRTKVGPGLNQSVQVYANNVVSNVRTLAAGPSSTLASLAGQPTTAAPSEISKVLRGFGQALAVPYQLQAQAYDVLVPQQVKRPIQWTRTQLGRVTGPIFKGLDMGVAGVLGVGRGILETFVQPTDSSKVKSKIIRRYYGLGPVEKYTPGMEVKPGPLWKKAAELLPNMGKNLDKALFDAYYGTGMGSIDVAADLARDLLLPHELKKNNVAVYGLAAGLVLLLDPLNYVTPATAAKLLGVTKFTKRSLATADEALMGTPLYEQLLYSFKRYPNLPEEYRRAIMQHSAEFKNIINMYAPILEDLHKSFGQNVEAQQLLSRYVEAGNVGARNAVRTKARGLGIDADKLANVGDRMIMAGDEMGRYGLSKGWFTPEEYNKLRGRYLRILYERYLDPDEFIKNIRKAHVPDEWLPKVYEKKLRSHLANTFQGRAPFAVGYRVGPVMRVPQVNRLIYEAATQPGRSLADWAQLVRDLQRQDPRWAGWTQDLRDSQFDSIMDLLTKPVHIGLKDGFLVIPKMAPNQLLHGQPLPAWQQKIMGRHFVPGTETLVAKVEGEIGKQIALSPYLRVHGLQRQLRLFTARKDVPQAIKDALREILEAGPRFGRQIEIHAKQRARQEVLEYLNTIAKTENELHAINPRLLEKGRWVRLTGTPEQLGPLFRDVTMGQEALHVPASFANYMNDMTKPMDMARSGWDKFRGKGWDRIASLNSGWKRILVPLNPPATFRNMITTAIMTDWATGGRLGWNADVMGWAFREMANQGPFYKQLSKYADLGADTYASTELARMAHSIRSVPDNKIMDFMMKNKSVFGHLWDDPVKLYGGTEAFFRLSTAKILHDKWVSKLGRALNDQEWFRLAEQSVNATINYADVPYWVDFVRTYAAVPISPFLTFGWKIPARFATTLFEHPTTLLKYPRVVDAINKSVIGEDNYRSLGEINPEFLRENMIVAIPYRGGFAEFNLGWIMPHSVMDEWSRNPGMNVFTSPFFNTIGELRYNQDFIGRPIFNSNNTLEQNIYAAGKYAAGRLGFTRNILEFVEAIQMSQLRKETEIYQDRYGATLPDPIDVAWAAMGGRPYRIEPEPIRRKQLIAINAEIRQHLRDIERLSREVASGRLSPKEFEKSRQKYEQQIEIKRRRIQWLNDQPFSAPLVQETK